MEPMVTSDYLDMGPMVTSDHFDREPMVTSDYLDMEPMVTSDCFDMGKMVNGYPDMGSMVTSEEAITLLLYPCPYQPRQKHHHCSHAWNRMHSSRPRMQIPPSRQAHLTIGQPLYLLEVHKVGIRG